MSSEGEEGAIDMLTNVVLHSDIFKLEQPLREREARNQRMAAEARAAAKDERLQAPRPRLIPRIAGALGLF